MILLALAFIPVGLGEEAAETGEGLCSFHDYYDCMPFRFDNMAASEGTYYVMYKVDGSEEYDEYLNYLVSCGYGRYDFEDQPGYKYCAMTYGGTETYFYSYYYSDYSEVFMVFYVDMDYGFDPIDGLD